MVQAISGLMSLTGDPDGPPYRAGISVFDVMAGLHANIGILAALHHRDASRAAASTSRSTCCRRRCPGLVNHSSAVVAGGTVPFRMGNAHPSLFPYEPLPTADGELIVIAGNDGQFRKLCQVLGLPDLVDDPRFARNQDRTANREALRPLLVERLRTRTKDEWFRDLLAAGVPCAPINTIDGGVALRRGTGPGPGGRGRRGRRGGAQRAQPDHVLGDPAALRAAAAGARRTRRGDPRMAERELSFPHLDRHVRRGPASRCSVRTWPPT